MRFQLWGIWIDVLTMAEAVERVEKLVTTGSFHQVLTVNPEYLYRAREDELLRRVANSASLVTADGVGVVWAGRLAGINIPGRVTGIDLMLALCRRASEKGWRVFFLGAEPGVAEEAAHKLQYRFPGLTVVGTYHGYFTPGEEKEVVAMVRQAHPHLLFVALGAPRQEIFIHHYLTEFQVPVAMGVGGSFDVVAGRVKRAPRWMQRLQVEWLARLIQQPSRWRRMLILPRFAWQIWKEIKWEKRRLPVAKFEP